MADSRPVTVRHAWLLRVLCWALFLAALPAMYLTLSSATAVTAFPNGEPPSTFVVVVVQRSAGAPPDYRWLYWRHWVQTPADAKSRYTFLLPERSADGTGTDGSHDPRSFEVIEDGGDRQIVEAHYSNTHMSWSRYRAYHDRIEPISYRQANMLHALLALALAYVLMRLFRAAAARLAFFRVPQQ